MMRKSPHILGVIPARYQSTRFPGKPLALIKGISLIQRTYENAKKCRTLNDLVVATDDQRIFDHVKSFGGNVVMTSPDHMTGTDRIAEVLRTDARYEMAEIIINIQGDEPCIDVSTITKVAEILDHDQEAVMSTAIIPISKEDEAKNPSVVKCVIDREQNALYFSRGLIPAGKKGYNPEITYYKHMGIYGYRRPFLMHYAGLSNTPLQQAEDLEQLKVLEHGYRIKAAIVDRDCVGVDNPEDIKKVEQML